VLNVIKKTGKFSAVCKCSKCNKHYQVKDFYAAKKSTVGDLCVSCKTAISAMKEITQSKLLNVFEYNKLTGTLIHKHTTLSGNQGELATYDHGRGYLSVCIGRKQYLAHRIIYLMITGKWPQHTDHINHKKQDNRWANLRNVIQKDNNRNMPPQRNSTTSVVGVSLHKPTGKYRAYISIKGKAKHLGLFDSVAAATAAREDASQYYGYHQNHGK